MWYIFGVIGFVWVAYHLFKWIFGRKIKNRYVELEELKKLKDENILTEEEYLREKRKILNH